MDWISILCLLNSPQEVPIEELMYEVGMPFDGDAEEQGRVKIKNLPEQMVLSTIHTGPYNQSPDAYVAIAQYAYQNGYQIIGPPMETYISDPYQTPESELETEICFPVKKRD
jgi:effector-binding domain-containing protein